MTPTSPYQTYMGTRHFGSLDGLRCLCIALVIWHHGNIWPNMDALFFSRGHTGVDFFFALSGFLITTLLLREEATKGHFSLRGFYWRRILRIVPVYFLVVSLAVSYEFWVQGNWNSLNILPYYYLFLSNFIDQPDIPFLSVTWSLAVEEQYYLIWPLLLLLLPRAWVIPVLGALIAWNIAVVLDVFTAFGITGIEVGPLRLSVHNPTYAPILMGSLLAVFLNRPISFKIIHKLTGFYTAPLVWFVLLLVAYASLPVYLSGWPNVLVHSLMCLIIASLVIQETHIAASLAQRHLIRRIGQISYGIYLYHLFALAIVGKVFEQTVGLAGNQGYILVLYFALAVVISDISFRTFETWFMNQRNKGWGRTA